MQNVLKTIYIWFPKRATITWKELRNYQPQQKQNGKDDTARMCCSSKMSCGEQESTISCWWFHQKNWKPLSFIVFSWSRGKTLHWFQIMSSPSKKKKNCRCRFENNCASLLFWFFFCRMVVTMLWQAFPFVVSFRRVGDLWVQIKAVFDRAKPVSSDFHEIYHWGSKTYFWCSCIQVGPGSCECGSSEFLLYSKSLKNSSPISTMLVCPLNLKSSQFERILLGISFLG